MAKGRSLGDWTVKHAGDEGSIRSTEYRARFRVRPSGIVHIIWQDGPEPADAGEVERSAQAAIADALRSGS